MCIRDSYRIQIRGSADIVLKTFEDIVLVRYDLRQFEGTAADGILDVRYVVPLLGNDILPNVLGHGLDDGGVIPVSYTHLDVYKRQVPRCP